MTFRYGLKNPETIIRVGLVSLVLASLSRWFLHPNANLGPELIDATNGVLYGVSIGCILLGISRRHSGRGDRPGV